MSLSSPLLFHVERSALVPDLQWVVRWNRHRFHGRSKGSCRFLHWLYQYAWIARRPIWRKAPGYRGVHGPSTPCAEPFSDGCKEGPDGEVGYLHRPPGHRHHGIQCQNGAPKSAVPSCGFHQSHTGQRGLKTIAVHLHIRLKEIPSDPDCPFSDGCLFLHGNSCLFIPCFKGVGHAFQVELLVDQLVMKGDFLYMRFSVLFLICQVLFVVAQYTPGILFGIVSLPFDQKPGLSVLAASSKGPPTPS